MTIPLLPCSSPLWTRLPSNWTIIASDSRTELTWLSLSLMLRRSVGQSVLEWSTHLGLTPDYYCCETIAGLLMWDALSDERTGLSFTIAPGPRQRSHFRVRVPWCSSPYFTVSDSRLPFSSPPTTRRVTAEVFDPFLMTPRQVPSRKHSFQQYLYCFASIRCCGNVFTKPLPRNGAGTFAYLVVVA
jgi:hypothetical protein